MEILYISYGNSSRSPVRPYKKLYRSSLVCPLILIRRATFWSKRLVRTVLGSMLTGIWVFSMEILYISYGEFFKVTCTAVQELYRSSLVCPLIPIRRAAFWSKRLVLYSPGKYVNWNLSFFQWRSCIAMGNSSRSPVRPYKNCTGQVWYVHWFPSGELRLGPNG